tara:strand:+ start:7576 stop:7908 length:333 start_codon:yes stop_codon:yes gene_type:complete
MKKRRNSNKNTFLAILKGEFIAHNNNIKYTPYILMLVGLMLINISVSFRAERLLKDSIYLENRIADLRLVYIDTKANLTSMYRRSVIEKLVANTGLKTSLNPPVIIEYSE